jgi:hypothetical protein
MPRLASGPHRAAGEHLTQAADRKVASCPTFIARGVSAGLSEAAATNVAETLSGISVEAQPGANAAVQSSQRLARPSGPQCPPIWRLPCGTGTSLLLRAVCARARQAQEHGITEQLTRLIRTANLADHHRSSVGIHPPGIGTVRSHGRMPRRRIGRRDGVPWRNPYVMIVV